MMNSKKKLEIKPISKKFELIDQYDFPLIAWITSKASERIWTLE